MQIIYVKPRNYISNANVSDLPESKVIAYAFTPDRKTMMSVDALDDPKTGVSVRNLKIWRSQDGEWVLAQFVHIYDDENWRD